MTSFNDPESATTRSATAQPTPTFDTNDVRSGRKLAVGVFGVGLPLIALSVEFTWSMCRDTFLDPLPTPLHACLIVLVAAVNTVLLLGAGRRWPWWGRVFSGLTIAISAIYSLIFLPVAPFGLIAILAYGLGLLALSPLLSLMAGLLARRLLGPVVVRQNARLRCPSWLGVFAALILFAIPMVRPFITYTYVNRTASADPSKAAAAVAAIRRVGAEQTLLDTCLPTYGRQEGSPLTLSFLLRDLPSGTVAKAYYRATGRACRGLAESTSSPVGRAWHLVPSADEPEGPDNDTDLTLTTSRIDATVDAPAALGYLEWTWVVHNKFMAQREGTAEIALPPGSVVSRATLWIDNEPREAAFAERHQAKAAYEKVVSRRRDPLLVMRTPQNTIQLKFFPVPAEGDLKLRIGITTPLQVMSGERATLALPRIIYRNFAPIDTHRLWVEAKTPFAYHSTQAQAEAGVYRLDRPVPARDLQQPGARLDFALSSLPSPQWARDSLQAGRVITQQLKPVTQSPPSAVYLVVDASRGQTEALAGVSAALAGFPDKIPLNITAAGDEPVALLALTTPNHADVARAAQSLRNLPAQGGADNATVLTHALEALKPGAALLWVHGAQPVELGSLERLREVMERSPQQPRIYELATASGQNRVVEALFDGGPVESLDISLGIEAALRRLFQSWTGAPQFSLERTLLPEGTDAPSADVQTSDHLVRLWANAKVEDLAASRKLDEAVKLAAAYKLVTSVSGAVVLENVEQYADAKLAPPGPEQLPSVPEPGTVVVVLLVMLALAAFALLQRLRANRVSI